MGPFPPRLGQLSEEESKASFDAVHDWVASEAARHLQGLRYESGPMGGGRTPCSGAGGAGGLASLSNDAMCALRDDFRMHRVEFEAKKEELMLRWVAFKLGLRKLKKVKIEEDDDDDDDDYDDEDTKMPS